MPQTKAKAKTTKKKSTSKTQPVQFLTPDPVVEEEEEEVEDVEDVEVQVISTDTDHDTVENVDENSVSETLTTTVEMGTTDSVEQILEMCKMLTQVVQKLQKKARDLHKRVQSREKRLMKLEERKANKKKTNAGNQLKKLQPVFTSEFTTFIEQNYQTLNNKSDEQILDSLSYSDSGQLLVSRENCLRLVNSYVRQTSLQQYDDKKRIKMDETLQGLFPELAEVKKGTKVIQEENCYFHTLMGGISRHLKDPTLLVSSSA